MPVAPISRVLCGLRSFMQCLLNLSAIERQSSNFVKVLCQLTGLTKYEIKAYLDKLDNEYIRVSWTEGGRKPTSVNILKTDFSKLGDDPLTVDKSYRTRVGNCVSCGLSSEIVGKDRCPNCYNKYVRSEKKLAVCRICNDLKELYEEVCRECRSKLVKCSKCGHDKLSFQDGLCATCFIEKRLAKDGLGTCIICKKSKKIAAKKKCWRCYKEARTGICAACKKPEEINAKGMCKNCYTKNRNKNGRKIICSICEKERPFYAKDKCASCYATHKRSEKQKSA